MEKNMAHKYHRTRKDGYRDQRTNKGLSRSPAQRKASRDRKKFK